MTEMKHIPFKAALATLALLTVLSCNKKPDITTPDVVQTTSKALPGAFTAGPEVFNATGGHIQGIAATADALYISQAPYLVKVDWTGKLIKARSVIRHTGDLCWWDGELFAAIAVTEGDDSNTPGRGKIMVYNESLELLREVDLDRRVDGITCLDGTLYVGMGSKTLPSKDAHRVNIMGRFDAKTLKEVGERVEFDYGYDTNYGVQDMACHGKLIYASFYAVSGPDMVAFDKDFKVIKTYDKSCSNGLDFMPSIFVQPKPTIVKATSHVSSTPQEVSCSLSFLNLD